MVSADPIRRSGVKHTNRLPLYLDKPLPLFGKFSLVKTSENEDITADNNCYSLSGAIYGIYTDEGCTVAATTYTDGTTATLTTDENGYALSPALTIGTYYVKEIEASEGYLIDETVYKVVLSTTKTSAGTVVAVTYYENSEGNWVEKGSAYYYSTWDYPATESNGTTNTSAEVSLQVTEEPANDPIGITLEKVADYSDDIWDLIDISLYDLSGAQFTICYYDTTDKDAISGMTPKRIWVIETKKLVVDGTTFYMAFLGDEYLVAGSDALYYDDEGLVVIPIGTITVQETSPADGYTTEGGIAYTLDGTTSTTSDDIIVLSIDYNGDIEGGGELSYGNYYTKSEVPDYVDLTLYKSDGEGNPLKDVTYTIEIYDTSLDANGNEIGFTEFATLTTDENGYVDITNLVYGTYRITEIETNDGYSLLAEPYVFTIDANSASPIEIHFSDTDIFTIPMTGGTGFITWLFAAGIVAVTVAIYAVKRRRRYIWQQL